MSHATITSDEDKKKSFNFYMANEKISDATISSKGPRQKGCAPLIMELKEKIPKLSMDSIAFHINNDSSKENIRMLASGSVFLY